MSVNLRTIFSLKMPDLSKIEDEKVRDVLQQIIKELMTNQASIYDDLNNIVILKTTTGDPTGDEGLITINTFDNKVKIYADGAWRQLATW